MPAQRTRIVVTVVVSAVLLVADLACFVIALGSLGSAGPNPFGYAWLAVANRAAALVALLVVICAALLAARGRGRLISGLLLAAAVVSLGGCVGLRVLGRTLAAIRPEEQPPALNSLLLALIGTGSDLMAVPIVLAAGAALTLLIAVSRRRADALMRA
jgi:hypothetical protein